MNNELLFYRSNEYTEMNNKLTAKLEEILKINLPHNNPDFYEINLTGILTEFTEYTGVTLYKKVPIDNKPMDLKRIEVFTISLVYKSPVKNFIRLILTDFEAEIFFNFKAIILRHNRKISEKIEEFKNNGNKFNTFCE